MRAATVALAVAGGLLGVAVARAQPWLEPRFRPLPQARRVDARKVALGRTLFSDGRLSRSGRLSCQSCHDLSSNGAGGVRIERGDAGRPLRFNTPTVFNSALNFRLGWEGRSRELHGFILDTIRNEHLMGGGGLAAGRLAADRLVLARFRSVYGRAPSDEDVADALSAFLSTLLTPDAPFDRWLAGDRSALTPQQVRGYERFTALGCASCHQGINVGGNLFQRRGIFHPIGEARPVSVRVPSLRNVAETAPYFHDGSVDQLPDAIRQMARSQLDLAISDEDLRDIAAFLGSLTGRYRGRPVDRPQAHRR